ncbi:glycoside hydrolase family 16 protein [Luminiphilus sp.]|nr:glycoside hydrolase family 16 protein [Luminiphilus sp.]
MFDRLYRHGRLFGIGLAAALLSACGGGSATSPEVEPFYLEEEEEWSLVWSDEFDGAAVDSANWTFQVGDGTEYGLPEPGWGNGERQWYQAGNSEITDDGTLVITAKEEAVGGMPYTSSRMRSLEKFDFKYGRVEIRAKAAGGQGLWSAIWMMPSGSPYGTWAASGEIDIMEVVNAGTDNQGVFLAAHHGFQWPLNQIVTAPAEINDASDWHTYALEWSGEYLRWFVDGEHLRTVEKDAYYSYYFANNETGFALATDASAPFNQDFHLIVNLAVGGNGPGFVDPADVDGSTMEVDFVRVYECEYGLANGTGCNTYADRSLETADSAEPFIDETALYADGPETLSGDRVLVAVAGYDNNGAMVVVDDGDAVNINSSGGGNAVIASATGETFELKNFYGAGELKFDMYIDSSGTAPSSQILIKMDSGYPSLGQVSLAVADLPKNEWFSYSIPVREFVENPGDSPLNLQAVLNLIVVEPTGAASLKLDNVSLKCASPYRRGCGISGPLQAGDGSTLVVLDEIGLGGGFWDLGVGGSSTDSGFSSYYESGSNQVSWSNTGDSLLVNFASSDEFGVWFVQSSSPGVDLSLYEDSGFLRFELKLPQETIDSGLNFKVENEYPDGTGDLSLDLSGVEADVWTSFEIPVTELLASTNAGNYTDPRPGDPLDIAAVQAAIVMWPAGSQGGIFFEIREIRYENDPGAAAGLCPLPTAFGVAEFSDSFGGTVIEEGGIYTYPSTAEAWGGFANTNTDMYPMSFPDGGTITFNAAVPTGGAVDVRFVLEFNPYPDVNPAYNTASVQVSGAETAQYTVDVPSQGENTFSSFLLYLNTQDLGVQISNVSVQGDVPPCEEPSNDTVLAPAAFTEAFGGTTQVGDEFTWPSTAEAWGGFANQNLELYPLSFPYGASVTFSASVPNGADADVRFVFEFNPYPDVNPSFNTEAVTVSGSEPMEYTINVPSQGENTFSSFLMYLNTQDVVVSVSNVVVTVL